MKKSLIFSLVFIILSISVVAAPTHLFKFDNTLSDYYENTILTPSGSNYYFNQSYFVNSTQSMHYNSTSFSVNAFNNTWTNLTVCTWMYPNLTGLSTRTIFAQGGSGAYNFNYKSSDGRLELASCYSNNSIIINATWQYICVVINGTNTTFYLNATDITNRSTTCTGVNSAGLISATIFNTGNFPIGFFDNYKIYVNNYLSQSEVNTTFLNEKATHLLNINIIDEKTGNPTTSNVSIITSGSSSTYTYNNNTNNIIHSVNPGNTSTSTVNITALIQVGSLIREQRFFNINVTTSGLGFNFKTPSISASQILFKITDTSGTAKQNIIIDAYDINNNYVESQTTDINGNAVLNLDLYNTYTFLLYENSVLVKNVSNMKINGNSYEISIGSGINSSLPNWLLLQQINYNLTYTNSTNLFNFSWNDPNSIGTNYCLRVEYENGTLFNNNCTSSAVNSKSLIITNTSVNYVAKGIITIDGKENVLDTLSVNLTNMVNNLGKSLSLFISILIFIVTALVGIDHPKTAIVMSIVALIFLQISGFIPLGISGLIGIIIVGLIILINMRKD